MTKIFFGPLLPEVQQFIEDFHKQMEAEATQQPDPINHPAHYNLLPAVCSECGHPIEAIDVVRHKDFNTGNAMKYLWRAGLKGDAIEDLKKAAWYIQDEIELLQKERDRANDEG